MSTPIRPGSTPNPTPPRNASAVFTVVVHPWMPYGSSGDGMDSPASATAACAASTPAFRVPSVPDRLEWPCRPYATARSRAMPRLPRWSVS